VRERRKCIRRRRTLLRRRRWSAGCGAWCSAARDGSSIFWEIRSMMFTIVAIGLACGWDVVLQRCAYNTGRDW
jgi:hypothetical protein